ncbi:MAG: hypothetical protein ACFFC9_00955 [Promethearchaeota archaeon]
MTEFEEKVLSLLSEINNKLDKLLGSPKSPATASIEQSYIKPSAVVEKQEEEAKAAEKPSFEGRRVCPDCGGTDFRAEEDKSQVLHQMGGVKIYSKKYICKRCGYEY